MRDAHGEDLQKGSGSGGQKAASRLRHISAAELLRKEMPPVSFIVPNYLPEGLTILAGRPKQGKSWLALGIAIAVASHGRALDALDVKGGEVLYLALEDPERRLQARVRQLLGGVEAPEGLSLATECPRLDRGGADAIGHWIQHAEDPRLVIVDVFTKVRPQRAAGDNPYESDYQALGSLKAMADASGVGVMVVHHVRKMGAEDRFDTVSGTTGFTGAADTILILEKSAAGATLYGRGRDIEDVESALSFDRGAWKLMGPASEVRRSDQRNAIITVLEAANGPMAAGAIADQLNVPEANVRQLLRKMLASGEVRSAARGKYLAPAGNEEADEEEDRYEEDASDLIE